MIFSLLNLLAFDGKILILLKSTISQENSKNDNLYSVNISFVRVHDPYLNILQSS